VTVAAAEMFKRIHGWRADGRMSLRLESQSRRVRSLWRVTTAAAMPAATCRTPN